MPKKFITFRSGVIEWFIIAQLILLLLLLFASAIREIIAAFF